MGTESRTDSWEALDPWWDTFLETYSMGRTKESTRAVDRWWFEGLSEAVDPWWDAYVTTHSLVQADEKAPTLDRRLTDGAWADLDPWWDAYSEARRKDVAELKGVLDDLDEAWEQSGSRFDVDPLNADWTGHPNTRGPLRPNQEENWSQWLAHLLRTSSGEFLDELFGDRFDEPPQSVRREVHLPDANDPDRYADILVFYDHGGISIEVKKNDEHYGKTTHTTGLVERQHGGDWGHALLLPKYKEPALRQTFGDAFEERGDRRPRLRSNQSEPISVVYWQDVSSAIRTVLLQESETNPHWEASSYLFCTLIEQKLLRFTPSPTVEQVTTADDVIHASQSLSVATGEMDEQLRYLRGMVGEEDE